MFFMIAKVNLGVGEMGYKVRKNAKIWDRYNQIARLTQDTIWESGQTTRKHHIQEAKGSTPFPAKDSMTDMKHK